MKRNLFERFIYSITQKPLHYVEVKNPPKTILDKLLRPQDARQLQYNRWCKRFKMYSGSYLPENDRRLLRKGWEDKKYFDNGTIVLQRKSTGQTIRSDRHGVPHHYHWLDFWEQPFTNAGYRKFKKREFSGGSVYYTKYGQLTRKRNPEHHLNGDERDD